MIQLQFPEHETRRRALGRICNGFGSLALTGVLQQAGLLQAAAQQRSLQPRAGQFAPRAKRIIFLFMHGGPSHVDLFDPKPRLSRDDGKPLPFAASRVTFAARGNLMGSPWKFRKCGHAGLPMSSLWQHLPGVADELCMIHSMCETNVSHGGACMKMHTGNEVQVRPSMGSWVSYGLGTENQNLPSFITICPTSLHGGVNNFGPGFLPPSHAGVPLGAPGYPNTPAKDARFDYMTNTRLSRREQQLQIELLSQLQRARQFRNSSEAAPLGGVASHGDNAELEARIRSFELAFRMQSAAPEAIDLASESRATHALYGMDDPLTENFGRECLLARRLAERGVRFIQVSHAHSLPFNNEQWDQHTHLVKGHSINVAQIDKPITGLLMDLKSRGLLDDTLVLWGGEFGRTPTVQAAKDKSNLGRDHHTEGFTMWLAGAGVKGGYRYGRTDEYGYYATENRCTIHDLHATLLHLMGLDHERLTYLVDGRDYRLTDVSGRVAHEILN